MRRPDRTARLGTAGELAKDSMRRANLGLGWQAYCIQLPAVIATEHKTLTARPQPDIIVSHLIRMMYSVANTDLIPTAITAPSSTRGIIVCFIVKSQRQRHTDMGIFSHLFFAETLCAVRNVGSRLIVELFVFFLKQRSGKSTTGPSRL